MAAANNPIPTDDRIDRVAEYLYAAYYVDSGSKGTWPPYKPANHRAWRRVAAAAIDLHLPDVETP